MNRFLSLTLVLILSGLSCSQDKEKKLRVGGYCEGCEAIYESPVEFDKLNHIDTLPGFDDADSTLHISGVVYKKDGVTPAEGVVLYAYHTNQNGIYPKKGDEKGMGKWHGYIRGWVRTNDKGEYRFYTLKPGPYPNGGNPAHIHIIVKEPGINEYYIDDFVFEGEIYVDDNYKNRVRNTGGSGIIKLEKNEDILIGKRNIILGKNVENYP